MLPRGIASAWRLNGARMESSRSCLQSVLPLLSSQASSCSLTTSTVVWEGKGPEVKNSPEQKKGVRTEPDMAPPDDDRQTTPSSKKTNELEKGAGAPAGKDALKPGQVPKGRGFFTSAWSSAGPDKKDSPEQKKGVVTDPDMAPPKPETGKHDTPSSQKTNELEKGAGAPSGSKPLKPGDTPKPNRSFHSSAASWADDSKRAADTDSPVGNAKDKDKRPDIPRGPSGRPDDPHMQVDTTADDHPAPKAG